MYTSFIITDQARAVKELTQHVSKTTWDVREMTRRRNDRKPV